MGVALINCAFLTTAGVGGSVLGRTSLTRTDGRLGGIGRAGFLGEARLGTGISWRLLVGGGGRLGGIGRAGFLGRNVTLVL
jgi:hypothetical protein